MTILNVKSFNFLNIFLKIFISNIESIASVDDLIANYSPPKLSDDTKANLRRFFNGEIAANRLELSHVSERLAFITGFKIKLRPLDREFIFPVIDHGIQFDVKILIFFCKYI